MFIYNDNIEHIPTTEVSECLSDSYNIGWIQANGKSLTATNNIKSEFILDICNPDDESQQWYIPDYNNHKDGYLVNVYDSSLSLTINANQTAAPTIELCSLSYNGIMVNLNDYNEKNLDQFLYVHYPTTTTTTSNKKKTTTTKKTTTVNTIVMSEMCTPNSIIKDIIKTSNKYSIISSLSSNKCLGILPSDNENETRLNLNLCSKYSNDQYWEIRTTNPNTSN
ncbi:hypothetical protein BCR36DRAFT_410308 [Piromyces finnis]|uniref:Uncharacterized protein n=1 Tax=Piromyces finnis TaxID=1754191 RepID=A0A1Y1VG32_9FUNG|nr:hypothetical protein BCR36DRAFT_410308 [Piromyces finnis]|eukprot:ORX55375.1 hypothetical protein BCR36DRAFT_410308 [Piromyces finnis]